MSQQGDNASKTSKKNTSHGQEDINAIINLDEDEDEEVQFVGVVRPPSVIDLIDLSVSPSTSQAAAAAAAGGAGDSLKTPDSETDASESSSGVTALNPQVIVVDPTAVAPAEAAAAVPTAAATAASASAGAAPVAPALECPICLQTCIHPARLPCGHIFCFLCVKGVAYKNRRCAMCRREIPAEFLDHPQLVNGIDDICTTRATEDGYQWYYEGRNGWWQYDDRTSQDLEEAFKKGEHSCTILVAGYVYIVDLELLIQQRQNEPARCRRVKRDLATIAKKGVAGLRIEGNQVTCDTDFNRPPQNNTATVQRLINTFAARDAALRIASDIISSTIAQADELSLGLAASNISDSANDLSNDSLCSPSLLLTVKCLFIATLVSTIFLTLY
ncbi:E3 ubiquitin-protein ligase RNF146-B isoform X2 [Drosophila busckii]|uniref:E3 ubiquitin-protein ligase RNF146-B isoform X2 n=1 Tax=Drosophila busckii TaxID=30019 RepID=UPI00083ED191|nr:E3 ubiquitin-protein ligase RNF146-B isoform X2 [Drosophila busckii]